MSNLDFFKRVLMVAVTIILLLTLWFLRSIWIMGFSALVIAIGISVPARWLQVRGMRRSLALILSTLIVGFVSIFLTLWIVPTLLQQLVAILAQLPQMIESTINAYEELRASNEAAATALPALDFSNIGQLEESFGLQPDSLQNLARTIIGTGAYTIFSGLGFFGSLLANLFFVVFIAIFFLYEPTSYVKASLYLVPASYRRRALEIWDELYKTLTTWISAQFLSVIVTMGLVFGLLGLWLDMPYALIVAVFAGLATFVPNIGAFLPMIPIAIFTLGSSMEDRLFWLLIYLGVYLLIQLTESNVITPLIVKSELDIPSGALMLFQLVAAALFGALGLLLAVPMLAVSVTLVREIYANDMLGLQGASIDVVSRAGQPLALTAGGKKLTAKKEAKEAVPPAKKRRHRKR